ncbi:MAG: D-alanyl-D-alanine carboxypeptidase family protein [Actinomycetes bacterium]
MGRRHSRTRRGSWRTWSALVAGVVVVLVVLAGLQYSRSVPSVRLGAVVPASLVVPGTPPSIPWPTDGQAALAVEGVGDLGSHGVTGPVPIASVAKMMTAYVVLHDHPLVSGAPGPTLTITPADYATYLKDKAGIQSVVKVAVGEQLTERQALQAALIPSGNNIATLLAQWDAGSTTAFVAKMNAQAVALGMRHTHYADPAGLSAATVSTATDQLRLAEAAWQVSTFRDIAGMAQATLPVAGTVYNVNALVGHHGIVGIKTGSDGYSGGCLVFAARETVAGGQRITVLGVVLGQQGVSILQSSFNATLALVTAVTVAVGDVTVLPAGTTVATLHAPWAPAQQVRLSVPVRLLGWAGMTASTAVHPTVQGRAVAKGATVGTLEVTSAGHQQAVSLAAPAAVGSPGLGWRLTRLP